MAFSLREIGNSARQTDLSVFDRSLQEIGSDSSGESGSEISGVWSNKGRVFVATNGGQTLWITDSFRRSRWTKCEAVMSQGQEEQFCIVSVIVNPSNAAQVYIVYQNSTTDLLEFNQTNNKWTKKHRFQLSNAKGAKILSIAIHPDTNMFFWCEKRSATPSLSACCVCMREVQEQWIESTTLYIGPVVAILHSCPIMDLYMLHKGVCLIPRIPDEEGRLMLFWTFVPRKLQAYIWNHGAVNDLDKSDFRSIMMDILPVWHSTNVNDNYTEYLISHTSHPTTLELLLIDSKLSVSYATLTNGRPVLKPLCVLSQTDNTQCMHLCQSFTVSLFIGLLWDSGHLTLHDAKSGIALCSIDDLEGMKPHIWISSGSVPRAGFWSTNSIWLLASKSVVDVAGVIQASTCSLGTSSSNLNVEQNNKKQSCMDGKTDSTCSIDKKVAVNSDSHKVCEEEEPTKHCNVEAAKCEQWNKKQSFINDKTDSTCSTAKEGAVNCISHEVCKEVEPTKHCSADAIADANSACSTSGRTGATEEHKEEFVISNCTCENKYSSSQRTNSDVGFTHCCNCRQQRVSCTLKYIFSNSLDHTLTKLSQEDHFSGYTAAVEFLKTWKLDEHAAKVALNAAISNELIRDCTGITKELFRTLFSESFQSPVLALALLWNNPVHRTTVAQEIQEFVTQMETSDPDNEMVKTTLNETLLQELKQFQTLNQTLEALIKRQAALPESSSSNTKSVGQQMSDILKSSDVGNPSESVLAMIGSLVSHSHEEVMKSVAKWTGLDCKGEEMLPVHGQRWRKIFRLEWKDGQWRKNRKAQEDQHNAFLSFLCHLAYNAEPDWLISIKGRGLAIVNAPESDDEAETYIIQTILDCLPVLKVAPSFKSVHTHATLLWTTGQELQALQVMLRHQMWLQAVEFFSVCSKDAESAVVLYTMLLKALLRSGVPPCILCKALDLAPKGVCTYEILDILKETRNKCAEPFVLNASVPTVGDMRAHFEKFLSI